MLAVLVLGLLLALGRTFSPVRAAPETAAPLKIAVVNIEKVFNSYQKKTLLDEDLAQWQTARQEDLEAQAKELEILQARIENLAPGSDQRTSDEKELFEKRLRLETLRQLTFKEAEEKRLAYFREIWQDIFSVISDYGEKNGYDLILKCDEKRLDSGVFTELQYSIHRTFVLYNSSQVDISREIIHLLNAER
jgi:Skp family chaperone for outer membrane proteins